MSDEQELNEDNIAIVGMGCRVPGAANVDEFWSNLLAGRESITFFDEKDLDPAVPAELRSDPAYVRARGLVDDCDKFDARFFGISPAEATVMDPQQRLFMEVSWQALEHAGCRHDLQKSIGVFGGTGVNTYYVNNVLKRRDLVDSYGEFNIVTANDKDYLATRMSYKLDLRGPSVAVQSACSTSLVAVVQAYWALMTYQCDVALAGGASIDVPVKAGYLYEEGSMLSADGHCRPFDKNANGTLFNNGVGVVVLKRLADAIRDNDRVYAVIRGAAINNDGQDKVSFSAPSVNGQSDVIGQALDQAGFAADTIEYVETHGTATPLGDPIEVEALSLAFSADTTRKQYCGIGSVKSNVGHLVAAAGVAGLIKTSLALFHNKIPASINYTSPNPAIDFANSPFFVVDKASEWQAAPGSRRAGVSSFGVGGTNAHVVLEDWPVPQRSAAPASNWQLLPVSAKSETALAVASNNLADAIENRLEADFADAAFTLQTGRVSLPERRAVVANHAAEAAAGLRNPKPEFGARGKPIAAAPSVAFVFPGQGSQHVGMARGLYSAQPEFRAIIDRCAELLHEEFKIDLKALMFAADNEKTADDLRRTMHAQPALFAVEYALARLWIAHGVVPLAMVGHSIGEFVAACIAGVFSMEDGLRIVARRGQLMEAMPEGRMLSVRAAADDVAQMIAEPVCVAAVNGPALCVLAGPSEALESIRLKLEKRDISASLLHTSHAFHSSMMDDAVAPLIEFISGLDLRAPQIPIVSTATASWLRDDEAVSAQYWGRQLRQTVRFGPAIQTLTEDGTWLLIEAGPRRVASQLARQQLGFDSPHRVVSSLGDAAGETADMGNWLSAVAAAWVVGVEPDWLALHGGVARARCPMPTYPFEKNRFWADVDSKTISARPNDSPAAPEAAAPSPTIEIANKNNAGNAQMRNESRLPELIERVRAVFADTSGMDPEQIDLSLDFVEQGFDSLFLTQAATAVKKKFGVKVTFRELMENFSDVESLARHLDKSLPPEPAAAPQAPASAAAPAIPVASVPAAVSVPNVTGGMNMVASNIQMSAAERLLQRQLDIMQQQLAVLGGAAVPADAPLPATIAGAETPHVEAAAAPAADAAADDAVTITKAPRAGTKIAKNVDQMGAAQAANLQDFVRRYNAQTRQSKEFAQAHRKHFADPRTASGFRPAFKELVYQIVVEKSAGSRVWDIDGNEYIDLLNGFGSNMLGHLPDYIRKALHEQADRGLEIGPQTRLAGEVAELFCELSGMERMAFSNTGSEAVAGAVRIARTVTGKNLIVTFEGDYHGIFDEVLVRGTPAYRTLPASPGVNREAVENMVVLPFNDMDALKVIRERGDDIAGILIECVQGGDPGQHPAAWLKELRQIADDIDCALICDEVITGFRVHPRGAQGYFGIDADLATYGKVVGGGLPIGVIAGKAEYMDALDGGQWQFGDDSIPEAGVTYFAGTFVRHPLTMAASLAALRFMKEQGPSLQENLNTLANEFAADMNTWFKEVNAPWHFENFGSLMNLKCSWDSPFQELLFYLMRLNGVHIWYGRPCFLTHAHTLNDLAMVKQAFKRSIEELVSMGFLEGVKIEETVTLREVPKSAPAISTKPPVDGARLGRDKNGNPGWFVADPDRPGKYLQVGVQ